MSQEHILGISAFFHDSAAALLRNGEIVAAAQEERFSRKKGDANFPAKAITYCLEAGGIGLHDLRAVGFYDKPLLKFERILESYLGVAPRGYRSFLRAGPLWVKEKIYTDRVLREALGSYEGDLLYAEHHESHAASAFFPSPFREAAVLTIDGVGEWATACIAVGREAELTMLRELQWPDSLGLLYSAFTHYMGFKVNSGEYKVMGLAPFGEPNYVDRIYEHLLDLREDGSFRLNQKYFGYLTGLTMTNAAFAELFGGPSREPETKLTQKDMDLARSIQVVCEDIMLRMAHTAHRETGLDNLVLAGGVALNCVGNGRVLREGPFKRIWIQPAAGDAGGALGVAYLIAHRRFGRKRVLAQKAQQPRIAAPSLRARTDTAVRGPDTLSGTAPNRGDHMLRAQSFVAKEWLCDDAMHGAYLGPEFSSSEIEALLESVGAVYQQLDRETLIHSVAQLIAAGKVVGWFNGRMEFGPRALGNRSILGDARSPRMQAQMNLKVKRREGFRPFAPSVLRERAHEYFELDCDSPYMLLVASVRKDRRIEMTGEQSQLRGIDLINVKRSDIPAVTHIDYSARVQTVSRDTNPAYYDLIAAFQDITGCPVLVNTSFNVRGEPIVCTPRDAYACFMQTDIDYLVLGTFFLAKTNQPRVETENWLVPRLPTRSSAKYTSSKGHIFGLTMATALAALSGVVWWRHQPVGFVAVATLAAGMIAAALIAPRKLEALESAWMRLAHGISAVSTPILMGLIYYVALTPVGLLRRVFGWNALVHRAGEHGYWVDRSAAPRSSLNRMF